MKLIRTTGCTAFSYTIDGKEQVDLTRDEKHEIFRYLITKIKKEFLDGNIDIFDIVEILQSDSYDWSEPCEQCGDSIVTETWEI